MRKLAAVIALVVFCVSCSSIAQAAGRGDWWMFHHDLQHTGRSPFLGPSTPTKKWQFAAGHWVDSSPAIGSDGTTIGSTPMQAAELTGVVAVAAGQYHTVAVEAANGSVSTQCAEQDNINVRFTGLVASFTVEATHPTYSFGTDNCEPDCTNCACSEQDYPDPAVAQLFNDGETIVEAVREASWWRPNGMSVSVDSGTPTENMHYVRVSRKIQGASEWPQFFVLYMDGNMRLIPHPPLGRASVCFGSSVIVGPAAGAERPIAEIVAVRYVSATETMIVSYKAGGSATLDLSVVDRIRARVRVQFDRTYELPFATFRSMWVCDGKSDVDHVGWTDTDGVEQDDPVLSFAGGKSSGWFFHRQTASIHNTSAPDIRVTADPNPAPTVSISAPSVTSTSNGPVEYTVTYAGATAVTLSASSITLNKTGTANGTVGVSGIGSATRTVTVSSATGNGTLGISIAAGTASNAEGEALASGPSVTFAADNIAPTVTINQASNQADPTNASPINFTVVFSEVVTDFATGDVTLSGTAGATTATVTGDATTYNVAVTGITGLGTVIATIATGVAHDSAGNPNLPSTSTDNQATVAQPPAIISLTPNSGLMATSVKQTLSSVYADLNGHADLAQCYLLINTTLSGANAVYVRYDANTNLLYLRNDANTGWGTGRPMGFANVLENSHCVLYCAETTKSNSSSNLTINWRIEFKPVLSGKTCKAWMAAFDDEGLVAPWVVKGGFKFDYRPVAVSLAPSSRIIAPSVKQGFTSLYADLDTDLAQCYLLINTTLSAVNAVYVRYDANTNLLYLRNDSNTNWVAGYPLGSANVLENSQCRLYCAETTKSGIRNHLTVNWMIEFKPAMSGKTCKAWMAASDDAGLLAPWVVMGEFLFGQPHPPTIISLAPNSGDMITGVKQTLASIYADPDGYGNLAQCYLMINTTLSGANAVYVMYDANRNLLYLRNDANANWGVARPLGSSNVLENSQCKLYCAETTVSVFGNNLTVNWKIEFKPAMSGRTYKAWMAAFDEEGLVAPWVVKGAFRVLGEMIYIPAGSFLMGNSGIGYDATYPISNEFPRHSVNLSGYWIGKYEVTRGEYRAFMNAGGYSTQSYWSVDGWAWKNGRTEPSYWPASETWSSNPGTFEQSDHHPVVGVSYYEAEAFCNWAGGHLPTEAQWERADRWTGTHANVYPWGDTWDQERCNCLQDGLYPGYQTAPVGSYSSYASPSGCQDMAANVWEWCKDWYQGNYYSQSPASDPQGPAGGSSRVMRGGGWDNGGYYCRCAYRYFLYPIYTNFDLGFRLVR